MAQTLTLPIAGTVQVTTLANLRQGAASTTAPVLRKLSPGTRLNVLSLVVGEAVQGNAHWYGLDENAFVWSGACSALAAAGAAPAGPAAPAQIDPSLNGYGLDPTFAAKLSQLLQACRGQGLDFRIAQGLRTPQTQALYYCQWKKRPPAMIDTAVQDLKDKGAPWLAGVLAAYRDTLRKPDWQTDALPGAGWHQWGEAADCYCYRHDAMVENGEDPCYATYAGLAEQIGLTAGFRFKKQQDSGHVQLRSAGGAMDLYGWSQIDQVMQQRFGEKPTLTGS